VATLPLQRNPTYDGASGLNYSGRVYTNQFAALSKDICKGTTASPTQIKDVMPNSISTTTLPVDDATKRISTTALQGYVGNLVSTGQIPGQMSSFDAQVAADKNFYAAVQAEYCFYEARYIAALTQFLTQVADPRGVDQTTLADSLSTTIGLNQRLNSLLEIIAYVGNDRAQKVNARSPQIEKANQDLGVKIATLEKQRTLLTSSDARTQTQEEMMRYSAEKNRAMNIQIMFFVALNVVALGTVLTVYKGVGA
jgi:hypothetical protein